MALLSIQSRHGVGVSRMSRMYYRKKLNVGNNIVIAVAVTSKVFHIYQPCLYICVKIKDYALEKNSLATPQTFFFLLFTYSPDRTVSTSLVPF